MVPDIIAGGWVGGITILRGGILSELEKINALLLEDRENVWYNSAAWGAMRATVLRLDHYECQRCRAHGRYRRAEIVHHVKHLKDRPDLALSLYDPDTGERQLMSVCKRCHEELHPESQRQFVLKKQLITAERWD